MSNIVDPNNCKKIKNNTYFVTSQAGFRKALKDYSHPEKEPGNLVGFPNQYPAVVTFSLGYSGYEYTLCNCLYLSDIEKILNLHKENSDNKSKDENISIIHSK